MKIEGGCHCGDITYQAEVDPDRSAICHCTDCQTLSGSAFRTIVFARGPTFRLLSGAPTIYVKTGESGAKRAQAFCPRCGSPIYSTKAVDGPKDYFIRVGTIRQRAELAPKIQRWARSRQRWVGDLDALPSLEKQ